MMREMGGQQVCHEVTACGGSGAQDLPGEPATAALPFSLTPAPLIALMEGVGSPMSIPGFPGRLSGVHGMCHPDSEEAMKYLCLIYADETAWQKVPKAEAEKWLGEYFAFGDDIRKSGHYVGSNALQPTHTATTVRVRNGKLSTTDGPFVETKEQLGGYYLIEAKDLNDAIQVAARIPGARHGAVEVRPVREYQRP